MNKKPLLKIYSNLAFTHKVHENESYLAKFIVTLVRITSIVLLGLALILQLLDLRYATRDFDNFSIWLTVASVVLQVFQLSFGFEAKHDAHRSAAKNAVALKNRLLVFIGEIEKHTTEERDLLIAEINTLYETAPQTGIIAKFWANKAKDN